MRLLDLTGFTLFRKELAGLLAGRAFWVLLLVQALLTGSSYGQAISLYTQASHTALSSPMLAVGLSPLQGVLVPTFGSLYLGLTLLFPFVAIRQLAQERADGTLPLLLQTRVPLAGWLTAKAAVLLLAILSLLAVPLSALVLWVGAGGHLAVAETSSLVLGYLLYAVLIGGLAWLAAAVMESAASAAILTLSATLGAWALDFAAAGDRGLWHSLGQLSLTAVLRRFESGLLGWGDVAGLLLAGVGLMVLAGIWLAPSRWQTRWGKALPTVLLVVGAVAVISATTRSADVSEDRRHSFAPAQEQALATLAEPLRITAHLAPDDPRLTDLERNVLNKLGRSVPDMRVAVTGASSLFAAQEEDNYGLIELEYAGRKTETRSTSPREILPLLWGLAGIPPPSADAPAYPGYPLEAATQAANLWFYLLLPVLIGLGWWRTQRN